MIDIVHVVREQNKSFIKDARSILVILVIY